VREIDHEAEGAQPVLVPMSEEERHAAGEKLAKLVGNLQATKRTNDVTRKELREEEKSQGAAIEALASTIRNHGR
jgi:hypothetical protein